MTKKIFALVLTVCVLGVVIGGCGSKTDDTSGTAGTAGATASTTGTTTGK
jgi:uncharacterized protein YceK